MTWLYLLKNETNVTFNWLQVLIMREKFHSSKLKSQVLAFFSIIKFYDCWKTVDCFTIKIVLLLNLFRV